MFHERAFGKRVHGNRRSGCNQFFRRRRHSSIPAAGAILFGVGSYSRLPVAYTLDEGPDNFVLPEIVDDAVTHRKHNITDLQVHGICDCIVPWRIWTVGAQLTRTIEPVPLFLRFVDDLLLPGTDNHDLAISKIRNV